MVILHGHRAVLELDQSAGSFLASRGGSVLPSAEGQRQDHQDVGVLFGRDPAELLHGSLLLNLVSFLQATLSFFLAEKLPSAHYADG
jgi:hypothetical protein